MAPAAAATMETTADDVSKVQCHYEVLGVPLDADDATIKKAHRKKALRLHPDKNLNDPSAAEQFRRVQEAYECLSDSFERKWYDEHRDAILKGWSANSDDNDDVDFLFDVEKYMFAGCYRGFTDDKGGFYDVYRSVFHKIYEDEIEKSTNQRDSSHIPPDFGTSTTPWEDVAGFYQGWESFTSTLSFAWEDTYDVKEAPDRRVRRAMEDENKKARKQAKRARNEEIQALVRFVKRRDPRVKARKQQVADEKARKEEQQKADALKRKVDKQKAKEEWREQVEEAMAAAEEEDRLAGRVRLADLEDDYDYGGKKGKKGKKKKKNKNRSYDNDAEQKEEDDQGDNNVDGDNTNPSENDGGDDQSAGVDLNNLEIDSTSNENALDDFQEEVDEYSEEEEEEEEEEPDSWWCECCRKEFKSQGQMDNHLNSKKHKQAMKKFEAKKS